MVNQVGDNSPDGMNMGLTASEKVAFHGSTPVIQRVGAAGAAVATTGSIAATSASAHGYTTSAQADAIVTLVNEIRAALVAKGIMAGA